MQGREYAGMHQTRRNKYADYQRRPNRPCRREVQALAQIIQFGLKTLRYVLPHDTNISRKRPIGPAGFIHAPPWTAARLTGNTCFNPKSHRFNTALCGVGYRPPFYGKTRCQDSNENFPAATVHLVEQSDFRNAIVDLVIR